MNCNEVVRRLLALASQPVDPLRQCFLANPQVFSEKSRGPSYILFVFSLYSFFAGYTDKGSPTPQANISKNHHSKSIFNGFQFGTFVKILCDG